MAKYSDVICAQLKQAGYTHCFFVAGGNIMHILESASRYFTVVPVVHEVAAGIAVEYFNECETGKKAFALVTAGPGLTNVITAIAGAFLESRDLLVIGGQVKTADLARGTLRQRGIQEVDGVAITKPITKCSVLLDKPAPPKQLMEWVQLGETPRKGPVFLELPIDISAAKVDDGWLTEALPKHSYPAAPSTFELEGIADAIKKSARPLLLIGGGVSRKTMRDIGSKIDALGIPIATTYNGADRIDSRHPLYAGRPNTWGKRYANLIAQQADLVVALGTRLGMQQTGFNWQQFGAAGKIIHVDCDRAELDKGHPRTETQLCADANSVMHFLIGKDLGDHTHWLGYCREIKAALPLNDPENICREGYISPYAFYLTLSELAKREDAIIPCSSGGAFTVSMQTIQQKAGQIVITDKSLASMGYGLSGAIGTAFANPGRRILAVEGDGGFMQNLQELGTVQVNKLPLKMFIFNDNGYASIRMTQKNYFAGKYVGCDIQSGLGIPKWDPLFAAYSIPLMHLKPGFEKNPEFLAALDNPNPAAFIVPIDPEQTYWPKITSRVLPNGGMESNPLHLMSPPLPDALMARIGKYLPK